MTEESAALQEKLESLQKQEEQDAAQVSSQELLRSRTDQELRFLQQNITRIRGELETLRAQYD